MRLRPHGSIGLRIALGITVLFLGASCAAKPTARPAARPVYSEAVKISRDILMRRHHSFNAISHSIRPSVTR